MDVAGHDATEAFEVRQPSFPTIHNPWLYTHAHPSNLAGRWSFRRGAPAPDRTVSRKPQEQCMRPASSASERR